MRLRGSWFNLGLIAFWVIPAFVAVIGFRIVPSARNPDISLVSIATSQLLVWFGWAIWSHIIIAFARRFPFERNRIAKAAFIQIALAVVVISLQVVYAAFIWQLYDLSPSRELGSMLAIGWRSYGDLYVVVYGAILGVHAAARWYDAWQEQRVVAAKLERDLSIAQLSALRSQLNPHFLFNSLNSVVTLIGRDPDGARKMVVRLADLLRATLGIAEEQEITLSRELDVVRNYLEIELVRFADRLSVEWDIDANVLDASVPTFALQPFVENAIVHGVSRLSGIGIIAISAKKVGDALVLSVADNGPGELDTRRSLHTKGTATGAIAAGSQGHGIGLTNLRARLQTLYANGSASVELGPRQGGGTVATLTVPFRVVEGLLTP